MGKIFENSINKTVTYINDRLVNGLYMTEDTIRYVLFYSLMESINFPNPNVITLEKKYSAFNSANVNRFINKPDKCELDTYFEDYKEIDAIEVKYNRNNSKVTYDETAQLGHLFNDINRLICLDDVDRYLFYVTDSEMDKYLKNGRNTPKEIKDFYTLPKNRTISLYDCLMSKINVDHFKTTAYKSINNNNNLFDEYANDFCIESLIDYSNCKLVNNHYLRVYKIINFYDDPRNKIEVE